MKVKGLLTWNFNPVWVCNSWNTSAVDRWIYNMQAHLAIVGNYCERVYQAGQSSYEFYRTVDRYVILDVVQTVCK